MFTNSKSIVQTFWAIKNGREPYYEKILYNLNARLEREQRTLTIIWIPSHRDIEGNERADLLAKAGATTTGLPTIHPFPTKKSIKLKNKRNISNKWAEDWRANLLAKKYGRSTVAMIPKPDHLTHRIYHGLSPTAAQWIYWCRVNYSPLNYILAKRNPLKSPKCHHCPNDDETLDHYIYICPQYEEIRNRTIDVVRHRFNNREYKNLSFLLSLDTGRAATIEYFWQTKRFTNE